MAEVLEARTAHSVIAPGESATVASACPLDCPDACSVDVHVEDGRVTRLTGNGRNPLTRSFICGKVRRFGDRLYAPERLLHPGRRTGAKGEGRFERLSWDDAFDLLTGKIEETRQRWGGEAILPLAYGGSNGLLSQDVVDARLFNRLGASRLAATVCAAPSSRAAQELYGKMPGVALHDYVHARLIVLWGANPPVSGVHLVPVIQEAQRRGAKLVVIDPRRTQLAGRADLHLAPRPGSDLPLALAVIRWLFAHERADLNFLRKLTVGWEELQRRSEPWTMEAAEIATGVPVAEIETFARLYADSSPAVVRTGWGLERNRNGGSAVAAAIALPAVAGKFRVRGGGYTMSNAAAWDFDRKTALAAPEPPTRIVNMNLVGRELLERRDPPIDLLFVYDCNPLATLPNQERVRRGLARDDLFTVVFDQVMTDTARWADLVLPATTFLEHDDLARGYGALILQRLRPVVAPAGEARPNLEVFVELCRRLGLAQPGDAESPEEVTAALLSRTERVRDDLARDGLAFPDCGPAPVQFADVFPRTCDWRVHFVPEALDQEAPLGLYGFQGDPASDRFPLALISPARGETISSTLGELDRRIAVLEIHPQDAAARSIEDGQTVRIWNELGEVRVPARLSADMRPGVVFLPKGLWSHNTLSGTTSNALVPDTLSDLGGGACFNDARVEVAPA